MHIISTVTLTFGMIVNHFYAPVKSLLRDITATIVTNSIDIELSNYGNSVLSGFFDFATGDTAQTYYITLVLIFRQ